MVLLVGGAVVCSMVSLRIRRAADIPRGSIEQLYGHALFPFTIAAVLSPLLAAAAGALRVFAFNSGASPYPGIANICLLASVTILIGGVGWSVVLCLNGGDRLALRLAAPGRPAGVS